MGSGQGACRAGHLGHGITKFADGLEDVVAGGDIDEIGFQRESLPDRDPGDDAEDQERQAEAGDDSAFGSPVGSHCEPRICFNNCQVSRFYHRRNDLWLEMALSCRVSLNAGLEQARWVRFPRRAGGYMGARFTVQSG